MKKINIFLLMILCIITLTSCKQDNEKKQKISNQAIDENNNQLIVEEIEKKANEVVINQDKVTFKDSLNDEITIKKSPKRVIGIFNSYTNLWYEAGGKIIGRMKNTNELNENAKDDGKNIIVGDSNTTISLELIVNANPDLVILSGSHTGQGRGLINGLKENNIDYIAMDYKGLSDYLKWLKVFSFLNDTDDYQTTGKKIIKNISNIIALVPKGSQIKGLLIFGTTKDLKAYLSNTANGEMLKYLGIKNIGDSWTSENITSIVINEEYVMAEDPKFIFVQSMSDETKVKNLFEERYSQKWKNLDALKNDKLYFLERNWYHFKPNKDYDKAFLKLAKLIHPEIYKDFKLE